MPPDRHKDLPEIDDTRSVESQSFDRSPANRCATDDDGPIVGP